MVTIIKTSHSIRSTLNYNENKVKEGIAECIGAGNFPLDVDQMDYAMKLFRFTKRLELNENAKRSTVHISLNFDPSEKHSKEKLMEITATYMEKIGFGKQPYLVYQHHDAGHPHVHLVTINIERDGKRIDLHHLALLKPDPARKEIEELFGLVKAEGRKNKEVNSLQQVSVSKIIYGKVESKKGINSVLNTVINQYKYSSLPELNAVLKQYNVMADRGKEHSKTFQTKGLVYHILDEKGKPIGKPIKASAFYLKPTLKFLEEKFKANNLKSPTAAKRIKNGIDLALLNKKATFEELTKALDKQGINTVLQTNVQGHLYVITYVDHTTKCVFKDSALGNEYSAKAIQERCSTGVPYSPEILSEREQHIPMSTNTNTKLADELLQIESVGNYLPSQLKKRTKKRIRKGQSDNQ